MPIKPENRARYPKEWPAIRARILEREGHRCKWCGVPNRSVIIRNDITQTWMLRADYDIRDAAKIRTLGPGWSLRPIPVVLTIAHLEDPNPENCADDNLAALCQRCHNRHDAPMRRKNAAQTIRSKKACGALDLEEAAHV